MQYQLHTLLIFDNQEQGVLVAWVIAEHNQVVDIQEWLQLLHDRGKEH